MKRLTTLLFATLTASFATGQLPAAEPESSFGLAPSAAPQLPAPASPTAPAAPAPSSDAPSTDSPVNPEAAPAKPFTREDAKEQYKGMDKTAVAEDKLRKHIQLRVATAKAERDPTLQAIKARALVAKTDYEQRKIFTEYYSGLYDLIEKIDPKLNKDEIESKKSLYITRFTQGRVAPTIDPQVARAGHN